MCTYCITVIIIDEIMLLMFMIYQLLCGKSFSSRIRGTSVLFCFSMAGLHSTMFQTCIILKFLFFKHNIFNQPFFPYLRRVNAIEHVIIPRIERTLAYIISELGKYYSHCKTNVNVNLPTWRPSVSAPLPLTFNSIFC